MADLNINITATASVFDTVIKRVAADLGTTVANMRAQFTGLSDVSVAAMARATEAVATFDPSVQFAARAVIDLRNAEAELNAQIGQTTAVIKDAGAATNVSADIVNRLASEQLALARVQRDLATATDQYKSSLNAVDAAQKEAEATAAKEMEVYNRLEAQIIAAAEANVTGADGTMAALAAESAMWDRLTEAIIAAATASKTMEPFSGAVPVEGGSNAPVNEAGIGVAEGVIAGVEAATAAKDAQNAATEQAIVANEKDTQSEQQLTESILAGNAARQTETASTEAGMAALREHAAASAQLRFARQELNAATAPTAALENAVTAARERQLAAIRALDVIESARTKALNIASGALTTEAAATNVASEAYINLAKATIANVQAQAELKSVQEISAQVGEVDAKIINEIAVAQENAARTALVLATAQKEATAETAKASEAQSLFRARLITSEYGVRAFFTTGITSMPVLFGVIAAGFGVRMVEAMQKSELELGNLSRLMGATIPQLAQMGKAAEAAGVSSDDMTGIMKRLDRTISDAASGVTTARLTLKELGVDMTEINSGIVPKTLTVMAQMADYMHANSGNAEIMRAAMRGLGTESVAMGAFLAQGSQEVKRQSDAFTEYGRDAQAAIGSTKDIAKATQEVSAAWEGVKFRVVEALAKIVEVYRWMESHPSSISVGGLQPDVDQFGNVMIQTMDKSGKAVLKFVDSLTYMESELAKLPGVTPPPPPQFAEMKPGPKGPKGTIPSDLPVYREQLSELEALFEGSHVQMLLMEEEFWQHLIDTGKVKGRDLVAVETEIAKLRVQVRKAEIGDMSQELVTKEGMERLAREEATFFMRMRDNELREEIRVLGDKLKANMEYNAEVLKQAEDSSIARIAIEESGVVEHARLAQTGTSVDVATAKAEVAQLTALEAEKLRIQIDAIRARRTLVLETGKNPASGLPGPNKEEAAIGMADPAKLAELGKIYGQEEAANRAHSKRMTEISKIVPEAERKAAIEAERAWESVFKPIERALSGAIRGVLQGTQSIGQAFSRLGKDILASIVTSLAQLALKWAEHFLIVNVLEKSAWATRIMETLSGNAAKRAIESSSNVASVISSAGVAGAAGFASVMAALPFPVNVAVAPGVMAEAIGTTLSNLVLASAAGGMEVPHDMIAQVHKDETILPAGLSSGLKGLINKGGSGGGDVHVRPVIHIHKADGAMTDKHIEDAVRRGMRRGTLRLS